MGEDGVSEILTKKQGLSLEMIAASIANSKFLWKASWVQPPWATFATADEALPDCTPPDQPACEAVHPSNKSVVMPSRS